MKSFSVKIKEFTTTEYQGIQKHYGLSRSTSKRYNNEFIEKDRIHRRSHGQCTNKLKKGM